MIDIRERYHTDPKFKQLVDMMVSHILAGEFTPSEMRLASMMASINADALTMRQLYISSEERGNLMCRIDLLDDQINRLAKDHGI